VDRVLAGTAADVVLRALGLRRAAAGRVGPQDVVAGLAVELAAAVLAEQLVVLVGAVLDAVALPGDALARVDLALLRADLLEGLDPALADRLGVGGPARLVARVDVDRVVAFAAVHAGDRAAAVDVDGVIAGARVDAVRPGVGANDVVAEAAVDLVAAGAAVE